MQLATETPRFYTFSALPRFEPSGSVHPGPLLVDPHDSSPAKRSLCAFLYELAWAPCSHRALSLAVCGALQRLREQYLSSQHAQPRGPLVMYRRHHSKAWPLIRHLRELN